MTKGLQHALRDAARAATKFDGHLSPVASSVETSSQRLQQVYGGAVAEWHMVATERADRHAWGWVLRCTQR